MFLIGSYMLHRACTSDLDARQHPVLLDENMDHGLWCFVVEALPTVPASAVTPTAEEVSVRKLHICCIELVLLTWMQDNTWCF